MEEALEEQSLLRPFQDDDAVLSVTSSLINPNKNQLKTYRRRWYILSLFTALAALYNMFWNTWSPIQEPCKVVFGWNDHDILLITLWSAVAYIVAAVPFVWLMDKKGLRASVLLAAFTMSAGKVVQAIPISDRMARTVVVNIGQFMIMASGPVILGAPPLLSGTWFPSHERTTGTAIASLGSYLGIAIAFSVGPAVVPTALTNHINGTENATNNITIVEGRIMDYLWLESGIIIFLFLLILVYFPSKPPLPPSASSSVDHLKGWLAFLVLLKNRSFWIVAGLSGLSFGIYYGWLSLLGVILDKFDVDQSTAGWLGCASTLAGVSAGILLARLADMIKHKTKQILVCLLFGSTISQLVFTLSCIKVLPPTKPILFLGIIAGGLFYNGTLPLYFELAMECVYPVTEGMTGVVVVSVGNVVLLAFYAVFMLPNISVSWMNWVTVVGIGICVPGLLIYREKYSRLDLDTSMSNDTGDKSLRSV